MADNDTHLLGIGYRIVRGGEADFEKSSKKVRASAKKTTKEVTAVDGAAALLQERYRQFTAPVGSAIVALTAAAAAVAVYVAVAAKAVQITAQFETGLVGLGKTANIEGAALANLGDEVERLSLRIPIATVELLSISQAAGQLGVKGVENILKFTEVVALLGQASDLSGEAAATALARILNVTGEAVGTVGVLASVIVALGNNFAATESQIAGHTGEVARATAVYEIGSAQAAAFGTTLAAFGVQSELAGSAIGRSFRLIETAVKGGGEQMEALARISRVSAEEISDAFSRSPVEAFNLFLMGLREVVREDGNVAESLASVGLAGEEILKVLPVLAKEFDTLARAQEIASRETRVQSALAEEAARNNATFASQLAILRNGVTAAGRAIGDGMVPVLRELIGEMQVWLGANRQVFEQLGQVGGQVIAGVAGAVVALAGIVDIAAAAFVGLAVATAVYLALPMVVTLAAWIRSVVAMTAVLRLSTVALIGVSGALTAVRTAAASLWALVAANPFVAVAAAVAILAGGLFFMAQRAKAAREEYAAFLGELSSGTSLLDAETKKLLALEDAFDAQKEGQKELSSELKSTQAQMLALAPVAERMREALRVGDIEGYRAAREQVEALGLAIIQVGRQSSLERVESELDALEKKAASVASSYEVMADKIVVAEKQLADNAEALVVALDRARVGERARFADLDAQLASANNRLSDLLQSGQAINRNGFLTGAFQLAQEEARRLQVELTATEEGLQSLDEAINRSYDNAQLRAGELFRAGDFERAGAVLRAFLSPEEVTEAIRFQKSLTAAYEEFTQKLQDQEDAQKKIAAVTEEQRKRFESARISIVDATRDTVTLTTALSMEGAQRRKALADLLIEQRVRAAARGLTIDQTKALEKLTKAQVAAERALSGTQTLQDLKRQLDGQLRMNQAVADGAAAVVEMANQLRLEEELRVAVTDAAENQVVQIIQVTEALAAAREAHDAAQRAEELRLETEAIRLDAEALEVLAMAYMDSAAAGRAMEKQQQLSIAVEQATGKVYEENAVLADRLAEKRRDLSDAASPLSNAYLDALRAEIEIIAEQITLNDEQARSITQWLTVRAERDDEVTRNSYLAGLREENDLLRIELEVLDGASNAQKRFGIAAREAAIAVEVQRQILAHGAEGIEEYERALRSAILENESLKTAISETMQLGDAWENVGSVVTSVLNGMSEGLGDFASIFVDAAQAFREFRASGGDAQGNTGFAAFTSSAGFEGISQGIGGSLGGVVAGFASGGGQTAFGGERSGSFASEGAQLGSIFGGWGAFAGAIIGSFFEKAGDVAHLIVEGARGEAAAKIHRAEGGLTKIASQIQSAISGFIEEFEFLTGAAINADLADIKIDIKDDLITVTTASGVQGFRALGDALAFVVERLLLAQDAVAGFADSLGENVTRLLDSLTGQRIRGSFEDIAEAVQLAVAADAAASGEFVPAETRNRFREINALRTRELELARKYGLVFEDVLRLTDLRIAQARKEISAAKDSLLGVSNTLDNIRGIAASMEEFNRQIDSEAVSRQRAADVTRDQIALLEQQIAEQGDLGDTVGEIFRQVREGSLSAEEGVVAYGEAMGISVDEATVAAIEFLELGRSLGIAEEELAALEASLADIPDAFSAQDIIDVWTIGASQAGLVLIQMLQQVRGDAFLAEEAQELQSTLFLLQLAAQIAAVQALLAATDLLSEATRNLLEGIVSDAEEVFADLEAGDFRIGTTGRRGGGRGRRDEISDIRGQIQELRLAAAGVSDGAIAVLADLRDFEGWIEDARRLGIAESELAQARRDNLQLLEEDLLAPFREIIAQVGETDLQTDFRQLSAGYEDALQEAYQLAVESARQNGTTVAEEFARLRDILGEAFSIESAELFRDELQRLTEAGDIQGLQDLLAFFDSLSEADLPPGLLAGLGDISIISADIAAAIAELEDLAPSLVAGLDLSSIQVDLDLAEGFSEVEQQLRSIQERYSAVIAEARELGSAEEELARVRSGHAAAIKAVKDSILESVRAYTDAVLGIGESERRLLDLQEQFQAAREGLAAADEALAGAGSIFDEESEAADQIEALEGVVISGLERIVAQAKALLDAEDISKKAPDVDILVGAVESVSGAVRMAVTSILTTAQDISVVTKQVDMAGKDLGDLKRPLLDAAKGTFQAAKAAAELSAEMKLLDAAEQRAIQRIGIDFIGSLDALGVSIPDDIVLELAFAQFELARAEALSAAAALAAAGAFEGLSFTLAELLEMIANADFDASDFTPRFHVPRGGAGGGHGGQSASLDTSDLDRFREELQAQIDAWNDLELGEQEIAARDLIERWSSLAREARSLGIATGELNAAFAIAKKDFVDSALEEFEGLSLSDEERDLARISDHFVDLSKAFDKIQASGVDQVRLEAARVAAIGDFWDQVLDPLERANTVADRLGVINDRFSDLVGLAEQYGGDLERIEVARQQAIVQFWDEALQPLRDFQSELLGQADAPPELKLNQAQSRLDDLATRALSGDLEAIQALPGAIDSLLGQARDFYGTGPAYQALFASVSDLLARTLALAPDDVGEVGGAGGDPPPITLPPLGFTPRVLPPAPESAEDAQSDFVASIKDLVDEIKEDRRGRDADEQRNEDLLERVETLAEAVTEQASQISDLTGNMDNLIELLSDQAAKG